MKSILNAAFYICSFLLILEVIYRLAVIVPPLPGDRGYMAFHILVFIVAAMIAGMVVVLFILQERGGSRRPGSDEEDELPDDPDQK